MKTNTTTDLTWIDFGLYLARHEAEPIVVALPLAFPRIIGAVNMRAIPDEKRTPASNGLAALWLGLRAKTISNDDLERVGTWISGARVMLAPRDAARERVTVRRQRIRRKRERYANHLRRCAARMIEEATRLTADPTYPIRDNSWASAGADLDSEAVGTWHASDAIEQVLSELHHVGLNVYPLCVHCGSPLDEVGNCTLPCLNTVLG